LAVVIWLDDKGAVLVLMVVPLELIELHWEEKRLREEVIILREPFPNLHQLPCQLVLV